MQKLFKNKKIKESYQVLRVLCGPMRFKIVLILKRNKRGLAVSELAKILNASLSRISHQLRILRKYKLVQAKRKNREILYTLANHRIRKVFPF